MDEVRTSLTETYYRDGAAHLPGALGEADLAIARALFDWSRDHPGQAAQDLDLGNGETMFIETHNQAARAVYLEALSRSGIPALVAAALQVDQLWFLGEQIYVKEGRPGTARTAWHQDADLPVDATGAVCLWTSFERLDRAEGLMFARGSHRGTRFNPVVGTSPEGDPIFLYPGAAEKTPFPDIDAAPGDFDLVSWPSEPGDAVLFHSLTIHGGAPVPAAGTRNTLCLRFFGPDTRYLQLPERYPLGTLAAEATDFLWDGVTDGEPLHRGRQFRKVFG